ncbi:class F sortase [Cohnella soli]|uniref:Class F sortase n=1 Tax=Cohnella soli TaxID=425005 RepID=A0ABW0HQL7_9BACL
MKQTRVLFVLSLLLACCGCGSEHDPVKDKAVPEYFSHASPLPSPSSVIRKAVTEQAKTDAAPPPVSPTPSATVKVRETKQQPLLPDTIWIPSVQIKSKVEPVGVLDNGQMDVPKSPEIVGVLASVKPGQPGNAIIAGHVDNYTGPAIFYGLKRLKPGHPIVLSNTSGQYLVFSVVSVETFDTAKAPVERIFGKTDEARLNLITCTGKFDRKKKEHLKRLVVFTRLMQ